MNMVRHDYERVQNVPFPIEIAQSIGHGTGKHGIAQHTGAFAGIEPFIYRLGEFRVVFGFNFRSPRLRMKT